MCNFLRRVWDTYCPDEINEMFIRLFVWIKILKSKINKTLNILACDQITCKNGGTCLNKQNGGFCQCPPDITGNRCEKKSKYD